MADVIWRRYVELWCEAASDARQPFTIMSHPDLAKKFDRYPSFDLGPLYDRMAEAAAAGGRMVEVNTSGAYYACAEMFPAPALLAAFRRAGVPCTVGCDSHDPANVARDIRRAYDLMYVAPERLADLLYLYGELRQSRRLAAAIVKAREAAPLQTISQLLDTVRPLVNPRQEKKELAQIFQALRIEVNGELSALSSFLEQARDSLRPGGRLAIITYHSLEDRLVKNFIKCGNIEGRQDKDFFGRVNAPLRAVNSKPIVPDAEEIERNPRSRSAKLRVAEKL